MRICYTSPNVNLGLILKAIKGETREYAFSYEIPKPAPEGWDFIKQGFPPAESHNLNTIEDFQQMLEIAKTEKISIIQTFSNDYYKFHPGMGEAKVFINKRFYWEYVSVKNPNVCYKIVEAPEYNCYELRRFDNGFADSCFVILDIKIGKDEINYDTIGTRFFDEVDEEDIVNVWKGVKEATKFIKENRENKCE